MIVANNPKPVDVKFPIMRYPGALSPRMVRITSSLHKEADTGKLLRDRLINELLYYDLNAVHFHIELDWWKAY